MAFNGQQRPEVLRFTAGPRFNENHKARAAALTEIMPSSGHASQLAGTSPPIRRLMRQLVATSLVGLSVAFGTATAGTMGVTAPAAEQYTVSPGGVDMRTGRYAFRSEDVSVGNDKAKGVISLVRIEDAGIPGHVPPFANFSHNWSIVLVERRHNVGLRNLANPSSLPYRAYVSFDGRFETFEQMGTAQTYVQLSRTSTSRLEVTGQRGSGNEVYTYTSSEGVRYLFRPLGVPGATDCSTITLCSYASQILYPDGTKYDLDYETRTTSNRARLKTVRSNTGYGMFFEYGGSDWNLITKACTINLAQASMASISACPSTSTSSASFSYTTFDGMPKLSSLTDTRNQTWSYTYEQVPGLPSGNYKMAFIKPGQTSAWLVNTNKPYPNIFMQNYDITVRQDFVDGQSWTYGFDQSPPELDVPPTVPSQQIAGGYYENVNNQRWTVKFSFPEVPHSLVENIQAPSIGQIFAKYLDNMGNLFLAYLRNNDPNNPNDPNNTSGQSVDFEASQQAGWAAFMLSYELNSLEECNECSSTSPYIERVAYQITPGPTEITDPLGRKTSADYCDANATFPTSEQFTCVVVGRVQSYVLPEGNKISYKYNANRISEIRQVAKPEPSPSVTDIVTTSTYPAYPAECSSLVNCDKPVTTTDARGNVTEYVYDPVHGGIVKEIAPPVNGISAVKRYTYVQLEAGLSNGSGGYQSTGSPIWLLSEERTCSATATVANACAGGSSDEVVTTYEYGPSSGPNNLLVRAKIVSSNGTSLRTCFGYDANGQKLFETSPAANLSVCP